MAANIYECFIDSAVRGHHGHHYMESICREGIEKRKNLNKSET